MGAIIIGTVLLFGMGLWYLSNSWIHPQLLRPMKAVLVVVGTVSVVLIVAGAVDLVVG